MNDLPWYFRADEWLHQHIDKRLGRSVALWRLAYTGPRKWFCDWTDNRLQRDEFVAAMEIARTMCLKPLQQVSTTSSGVTTEFRCRCPKCQAGDA